MSGERVVRNGLGLVRLTRLTITSGESFTSSRTTSGNFKVSVAVIIESLTASGVERGDCDGRGDRFARGDWRGDCDGRGDRLERVDRGD